MSGSEINKSAILIFAKYPIENYVKTRLETSSLQPSDTLELYKAFLKDTIINANQSKNTNTIILSLANPVEFGSNSLSKLEFFNKNPQILTDKVKPQFHIQPNGSFGEKMADAIKYCRSNNFDKLVILGADAPHTQPELLDVAFDRLDKYDIVLGPSVAGGIYLIGIKNNYSLDGFPTIFEYVELSSFARDAQSKGLNLSLLHELTDVDTEEDLIGLISWIDTASIASVESEIVIPEYTKNVIKELGLQIKPDKIDNRKKTIIKAANSR